MRWDVPEWAIGAVAAIGSAFAWLWRGRSRALESAHAAGVAAGQAAAGDAALRAADATISQRLDAIAAELAAVRATQGTHGEQLAALRVQVDGIAHDVHGLEERRRRTSDRVDKIETDARHEREVIWAELNRRTGSDG